VQNDWESAGRWWGNLRSKSFKGDLLVLRIHGREMIWLNPTAWVGRKDVRLWHSGQFKSSDGSASSEAHHKKQEGYSQEGDAGAQLYRG